MSGRTRIQQFFVGILLAGVLGCGPAHPVYLTSKGQVDKHYINSATRIEYPDTHVETSQEVLNAMAPLTVANPHPKEYTDISLEEAVCMTMQNSRVIRTLNGVGFSSSGVQGDPQGLLSSPNGTATVYDVALVESDPRYGVEAALSAFDAQLKSTVGWTTEDRGALNPSDAVSSDVGTFQTSLQKTAATGGAFYMTNGNNYYGGSRYPDSYWTTYLEAGVSQPLLQGRGVQFNRIAGPGAIAGFYNGVAIARINTDSSIADFEMATTNLVYDVERAYWNLYYAYHLLESVRAGYLSSVSTWQIVEKKFEIGTKEGNAVSESQARQQHFLFRQRVENAQSNLFSMEAKLRYIMGITPTDGRLFRPSSVPTVAPLKLNEEEIKAEALVRSPQLRKQRWDVKSKELQVLASKNFLLPRLDINASYRFNGVGDHWIESDNKPNSAYGSLTRDGYGDWNASLVFTAPLGKRKELAAVRNAELALARSRSILQEQELELTHNIQSSIREIVKYYQASKTGLQRRVAAQAEVSAVEAALKAGTITVDQVLDAQRRLAEAETELFDNIINYNLSITELHRRKGSLLEYNNVYLAEGPWPNKAYSDAWELARKRDASQYLNYGYTRPQVFSRGEYQQIQNRGALSSDENVEYYEMDETQPYSQPATETIETEDTTASIQMIRQMPAKAMVGSNGNIVPASAKMPQTQQRQLVPQTNQYSAPQQNWVQEPARPVNQAAKKLNQSGRPFF